MMKTGDTGVLLYSLPSLSSSLSVWLWEVPKATSDLWSLCFLICRVEMMVSTWQGDCEAWAYCL